MKSYFSDIKINIQRAAVLGCLVAVSSTNSSALDNNDQAFVRESYIGGMVEMELGQFASKNGVSPSVKKLGQHMQEDHSNLNQNFKELAKSKNLDLPNVIPADKAAEINELKDLSPSEFDKAYAQKMINDHEKNIARFEKREKESADQQLKAELQKALPVLREHLSHAEKTQNSIEQNA